MKEKEAEEQVEYLKYIFCLNLHTYLSFHI